MERQIQQFKGSYFVCGKVGSMDVKCYQRKPQDSKKEGQSDVQANFAKGNEVIVIVVFEENLVLTKLIGL